MSRGRAVGLTHEERVEATRQEFQTRVGTLGAELWTISEVEAEEFLSITPVSSMLHAFTMAANVICQLRDEQVVYMDEEHCIALVHQKISEENAKTIHQQNHKIRHSAPRRERIDARKVLAA